MLRAYRSLQLLQRRPVLLRWLPHAELGMRTDWIRMVLLLRRWGAGVLLPRLV